MKPTTLVLIAFSALTLSLRAATPPAEKLLPADTLAVFTVPDWNKSSEAYQGSPWSKLWSDPAMKPFRDKFTAKFQSAVVQPLEKELGIKFADYTGLVQGQFTLALTRNGWDGKPDTEPAMLMLADAKDKSSQLATNLAALRKKWTDGGKAVRSTRIRDVEFTTVTFSGDELGKVFDKIFPDANEGDESLEEKPKKKATDEGDKKEITLGQSGSLLIVSDTPKEIERVLVLQGGGSTPTLSEEAGFSSSASSFRDVLSYGWVDAKTFIEVIVKSTADKPKPKRGRGNDDVSPEKVISALGLKGLQSASVTSRHTPDGELVTLDLKVPASARKGLFKMLTAEAKDSGPPPFVTTDIVQFTRWRLDFSKLWAQIEATLNDVSPQMATGMRTALDMAGKDKDPNFDLREQLFSNLGDDLIFCVKNPRENTLQGLNTRPSLTLLGARNAEQVTDAIKSLYSLVPREVGAFLKFKEREFLGRKVYSLKIPNMGADGEMTERTFSFAAGSGYVAFSMDTPMLEEYLRSGDGSGKPLREISGLSEAAQKVGGLSTGLFIFENQQQSMKALVEVLKKDGGSFGDILANTPLGSRFGGDEADKVFKEWFDFSLLPSFDKIAKYFYVTATAGNTTADGYSLKIFSPTPPQLK